MRRCLVSCLVLLAGLLGACTSTPAPSPSDGPDNTAMVLADPAEPASLNPLAGFAPNGAAKIFDGLLEYQPDGTLRPDLAQGYPVPAADGKSWTVTLRTGVKFSDGTPFGVADVLATYRALLDPAFDSPLRASYQMLTGVDQVDKNTIRFDLAAPYAPFPDKLVLGILPASALATPAPVATSPFGGRPIGTGPYTLVSWTRGKQLVLAANPAYFGGVPKVKRVTVLFGLSETDRENQLHAGKLDGAALPPPQAATFAHNDAFGVLTDQSADLRAVSLPVHNPVTGDATIRLALNEAVNRAAMVSGPLGGQGSAASTPVPTVLPEFIEPGATFSSDQTKAQQQLQQAGWVAGTDGIRARNGVTAAFTLDYPAGNSVDKGLADQFASDAQKVGILVTEAPVDPRQLPADEGTDAALISSGNPFDPDFGVYPLLHSAPAGGENLFGYADPAVDAALDMGRQQTDPAQRAVAYRQVQRSYVADPGLVCLVFAGHTYVMRTNWTGYQGVTEGTGQGFTWGPWWNLNQWAPK